MSYSEQALDALQNHDLEGYQKNLELAEENDESDLLFSLAEEIYSLGFADDALQLYRQLLKQYPDEDQLRTYIADILIAQDETDEALDYLHQIQPDSEFYLNSLLGQADLYQTQGLTVVSEQKLKEATRIAPDEPVVKFALAELYFSEGKYAEVIPLYLDLIKSGQLNISNVNLVERIGVAYANVGNFENAIGYLEQIQPSEMSPDVQFETGFTYFQLGDFKKAIAMFETLRDTDPQYSSLYPYLGQALEADHQLEAALRVYQEGIGVDEYNVALYLLTAKLAEQQGDSALAIDYLQRGHEANPDNLAVITQLAAAYLRNQQNQAVVDLLDPYRQDHETDGQLDWDLAVANARLENWDAAASDYEQAYPSFKDDPEFLKEYILFLRETGEVQATLPLLRRYVKLAPNDDEMIYMLEDLEEQ
ncbi:tetratricopeptide repeat protein [Fructilactobacillus carniphilus]|uniref:Tetratricopeptide repeat protein n=1 Tax=Fructilactobacillus carniphilus TaxID=2940297 RepID=A0ABY5C198_9LACO|nr:tetratricopeptide repeat protein [Fructilactobacillus carniphilus]USS91060.1 tetratricopeptide repeat protein [Fructilactobacillus carniphilus]